MIGVLNPKSGNITSVCDMLERLNRPYRVIATPDELDGVGQILLPGQGRFGAVMRYIGEHGWIPALEAWVKEKRPILGICAGMQVMFEQSDEDPDATGLGFFKGRVQKLDAPKHPMIGWSNIHWQASGFREGAAYFVNSYGLHDHPQSIATTTYGKRFCVAVQRDNIIAFQFHPEKSGNWGRELMEQCLIT